MRFMPSIERVISTVIAEFAPLPMPFLKHILQSPSHYLYLTHPLPPSVEEDTPDRQFLEQVWLQFIDTRGTVATFLEPFAVAETALHDIRLTTSWFQDALRMSAPTLDLQVAPASNTTSDWVARGLLRNKAWGQPELNSAAAILIMRSLFKKQRNWLPSKMKTDEPWFWVWGCSPKTRCQPPMAYPYPLPTLPAQTLLWSPWPGIALQENGWKLLNKRGAVRWAGVRRVNGKLLWNLSLQDLCEWDEQIREKVPLDVLASLKKRYAGLPILTAADEMAIESEFFHPFADELLVRIGSVVLTQHVSRYYTQGASIFMH